MQSLIAGIRHPFFNQLWRRVAMFVFMVAWTSFEFYMGSNTWGVGIAALTALIGWVFFLSWHHVEE